MAESKAVGSPVTHELDSERGRSTPGFGLPTEELDILAADDRDAESDGGALATVERLGVAARPVCAIMVSLPRPSAPADMARDGRFGGSGATPDQSFCETK